MRSCYAVCILFFVSIAWTETAVALQALTLITEENPPDNYLDPETGELVGWSTALVKQIMAETDIPHEYKVLPWSRGYARAINNADTCIFVISRTPQREKLFEWVAVLHEGIWVFNARADHDVSAPITIEDILSSRIASLQGSSTVAALKEAGAQNIIEARTSEIAIKMLQRGRVDYWLSGGNDSKRLAKLYNIEPPKIVHEWKKSISALACSHKTNKEWLNKLKDASKIVLKAD